MKLFNYHFNKAIWNYLPEQDLFFRLGRFWHTPLADRFNYLNKYSIFNFETFEDQKPQFNDQLDYKELCLKRAKQLVDQCPNGIAVSVSGGVDSAGIVCSLIAAGIQCSKLRVICNDVIKQEFPGFLEFLIKLGVNISYMHDMSQYMSIYDDLQEDLLVFGWCNDQLFHHVSCYKDPTLACSGWVDGLVYQYRQYGIDEKKWFDHDIEALYQYAATLNWPIELYYDLCVLLNFGTHYDVVRHYFQESTLNSKTRKKVIQFFDTQEFQNWGYTNRQHTRDCFVKVINGNNYFYKTELKQIICDITKDTNYLYNKGKEPSWGKTQKANKADLPFIVGVRDVNGYHVSHLSPYYINSNDMQYCNQLILLMLKDYIDESKCDIRQFMQSTM